MADVQLTAAIDAAGFNRGINQMKQSLADLASTSKDTSILVETGLGSIEGLAGKISGSTQRLEHSFKTYAASVNTSLNAIAHNSASTSARMNTSLNTMANGFSNLASVIHGLRSDLSTLLAPLGSIGTQSASTVKQLTDMVTQLKEINNYARMSTATLLNMNNTISNSSSSSSQSVNKATDSFNDCHSAISSVWDILQSLMALGFGTEMVKKIAEATGYMQQLEASFRVLLGSATEARNMMGDLVNFAMKTPFDLKGTSDAAKQLLAYGIAAEDVIETERRLGDVGAALGLTMRDLAYLYGTTKTQDRLYALDMRQFTTRGIPMLETLSEQLHVTTADITKMVTAGQIGFKEVKNAIWAMTDEGGQFGGLMDAQFNTLKGQLSNLGDAWYQFQAALGTSVDIKFDLTDKLSDFNDKLMQLAKNADILINTLIVVGTTLGAAGFVQGSAWLIKLIVSFVAFGTVVTKAKTSLMGLNLDLLKGNTAATRLTTSWTNFSMSLRNFSANAASARSAAAAAGASITSFGARMTAAGASARLFGTALAATVPYLSILAGIASVIGVISALTYEEDENVTSQNNLAKAAVSAETEIAKMYSSFLATTIGTEQHTAALNRLIAKLVENNIVSNEYCNSLTTEAEKTQLLIDKKNELAEIERNKQIRSSADTERDTVISNAQEDFSKYVKDELDSLHEENIFDPFKTEYATYNFDIDTTVAEEKVDAFLQQVSNSLGYIRGEMAVVDAEYETGAISAEEHERNINSLRAKGLRSIEETSKAYAVNAYAATKVQKALQEVFTAATTEDENPHIASSANDAYKEFVFNLSEIERQVKSMSGSFADPHSEYVTLYQDFKNLSSGASVTRDNVIDVANAIFDLVNKAGELNDPELFNLDVAEGAGRSLDMFVKGGEQKLQELVEYANEHPTEFTSDMSGIDSAIKSIRDKIDSDPKHFKEHTTEFTGDLVALNNALNSGAKDIEDWQAKHGKINMDFGVIVRNNSFKAISSLLTSFRNAVAALGLDDLAKKVDDAIKSIDRMQASRLEEQTGSYKTPGDRFQEVRIRVLNRGGKASLDDYNEFTDQELANRRKDIDKALKETTGTKSGDTRREDLRSEDAAIAAELEQRNPKKSKSKSKSKASAAKKAGKDANKLAEAEAKLREMEEEAARTRAQNARELENKVADARISALEQTDEVVAQKREQDNKEEIDSINKDQESAIKAYIDTAKKIFDQKEKIKSLKDPKYKVQIFDRKSFEENDSGVAAIKESYSNILKATYEKQAKEEQDALDTQVEVLYDYISKYGAAMDKRLAMEQYYDAKIREEQDERKKDALRQEKVSALSKFDADTELSLSGYNAVSGELENLDKETLTNVRDELAKFISITKTLSPEDFDTVREAISKLDSQLNSSNAIKNYKNALSEVVAAKNEAEYADSKKKTATTSYSSARKSYDYYNSLVSDAKTDVDKARNSGSTTALSEATAKYNSLIAKRSEAEAHLRATTTALKIAEDNYIKSEERLIKAQANQVKSNKTLWGSISSLGSALSSLGGTVDSDAGSALSAAGSVFTSASSIKDNIATIATSGFSLESATAALSIAGSAFSSISESLGLFGIGDSKATKEAQELAERYSALKGIWDELISKKQKYIDISYGSEARASYEDAQQYLTNEVAYARKAAAALLGAGSGWFSHSYGYRMWEGSYTDENGRNWQDVAGEISHALGVSVTGMQSFTQMSSQQLEWIKENYVGLWAAMDGDFQGFLQDIIDAGETEKDLLDKLNESITSTSFDDFYNSFVDLVEDMDSSVQDFSDNFEEYLRNAILESLMATKYKSRINNLYESWANAYDSDKDGLADVTIEEMEALRDAQAQIAKELRDERDSLFETLGFDDTSAQEASSGAFKSMTSDQADELNGRFTAIQGYVARIVELLEEWDLNWAGKVKTQDDSLPITSIASAAQSSLEPSQQVSINLSSVYAAIDKLSTRLETINANVVGFNTSYNTSSLDTKDSLDTLKTSTAALSAIKKNLQTIANRTSNLL